MSELCDLIEAALRKLRILPERIYKLEFYVGFLEETLSPMPVVVGSILRRPLTPHEHQRLAVHYDDAVLELQEVADKLSDLRQAIQRLSPTAEDILDQHELDVAMVKKLRKIIMHSLKVEPDIRHAAVMAAEWSRDFPENKKGRPRDYASLKLAEAAGFAYEGLTGKTPTISTVEGRARGPFLDLVGALFEAGGIEARPEAFAREAVKSVRAATKENPFKDLRRR